MKNKQKGIVTTGFTPSNNELRLKMVKDCGLSTYGVYIQILSHRNTSTNECFPKNDIIAEECSCSVANVKKHINKLYEFGYLVINSGYTGKASNYYFPLEIDLNTNKSIYSDAELERISNIKRRTKDNIVEEVPAQDNNKLSDNKTFTPIGKYVDEIIDDDLFIEEEELNIPSVENNPLVGVDANDIYELDERLVKNNKNNIISIDNSFEEELNKHKFDYKPVNNNEVKNEYPISEDEDFFFNDDAKQKFKELFG